MPLHMVSSGLQMALENSKTQRQSTFPSHDILFLVGMLGWVLL